MSYKDPLGDRMKQSYENRAKTFLPRRVPVIIRLDGKAFHTFTRGFSRPYDQVFHNAMNSTLHFLCKNIQGCKFGYTQSDEITLVLTDYDKLTTDAWFNYNVQKMCSIASSMATLEFNRQFKYFASEWLADYFEAHSYKESRIVEMEAEVQKLFETYNRAANQGAFFDARCFSVPEDEVTNTVIWRQNDATRNAIQMLGQTYFSNKELDRKSQSDIQDMLMEVHNINFNDMPVEFKRGVCCYRGDDGKWIIDKECPIISKDREYVEKHICNKEYK